MLFRPFLLVTCLASSAMAFLSPSVPPPTLSGPVKGSAVSRTAGPRTVPRVYGASTDEENIPAHMRSEMEAEAKEARERIGSLIKENNVMLFMKGNKMFPMCGFSNTAVQVLRASEADFETFDVLSDPAVRDEIKKFSNWPTIPQCFINGDFVGGSDILLEMFESGELQTMLSEAKKKA